MNGIYLYFVNKHLSSWPQLGLQTISDTTATIAARTLRCFVRTYWVTKISTQLHVFDNLKVTRLLIGQTVLLSTASKFRKICRKRLRTFLRAVGECGSRFTSKVHNFNRFKTCVWFSTRFS